MQCNWRGAALHSDVQVQLRSWLSKYAGSLPTADNAGITKLWHLYSKRRAPTRGTQHVLANPLEAHCRVNRVLMVIAFLQIAVQGKNWSAENADWSELTRERKRYVVDYFAEMVYESYEHVVRWSNELARPTNVGLGGGRCMEEHVGGDSSCGAPMHVQESEEGHVGGNDGVARGGE